MDRTIPHRLHKGGKIENLAPLLCNKGELTEGIKNETTFYHITGVCWRIKRSSAGAINLA